MRCSETPLRSHPVSVSIRNFWTKCTSLDAFLGLVAAPSDKHGELFAPSFPIWREASMRFHRPSLRASVGQIFLSTGIGFVVAHVLPIGQRFSSDPLAKMVLIATCVLTLLTHLMVSSLDGTSHELDPKRYQSVKPQYIMSFRQFPSLYSTFGSAVVVVPAAAIAVVYHVDDEDAAFQSSMFSFAMLGLVITIFISIYLLLVNEASKMALCIPGLNLKTLVKLFSTDPSRDTLIVMLDSILQGSEPLLRSIYQPTLKAGVLYAEDEELKRGDDNMDRMAKVLLFMDRHLDRADALLESDILCMLILETLGGIEFESNAAVIAEPGHLSPRHLEVIKQWANPQNAAWMGAARREPDAVPLVRALCAYAGGLGEALEISSLLLTRPSALLSTTPHC